jgi:hypothetical protein
LARFAMEEGAEYGGVNNMLAVAHVLRNRVFAGWGDWVEVVTRAHEKRANTPFVSVPNLRTNNARVLLNRIDEVYTRADASDLTGGALFYVDPAKHLADWFKREVLEKPEEHPRVAHIGPVWFYK